MQWKCGNSAVGKVCKIPGGIRRKAGESVKGGGILLFQICGSAVTGTVLSMSKRTWSKVLRENRVGGIPVILPLMEKAEVTSFYVVVWPARVNLISRD